jgi:hypothetical protein
MVMETNQKSSIARRTPFRDEHEAGPSFSGGSFLAASIWIDRRRELSAALVDTRWCFFQRDGVLAFGGIAGSGRRLEV